ncbi:ABC transporter permease [Nocardioides sp. SR21]|uniref:ABC transporter permease n=1 Tax=Nocardioides sp. SR21 TaxID=2919501 RepID=UPI001FA9E7CA|nr:ABC transporter permease [Nocardioides sp. SR21]
MPARWPLFVLRKVGALVVTLLVSSLTIFLALHLAPGDPATAIAGGTKPNPENLARIRAEYNLDDPWWSQYLHWLHGIVTGDLGTSMVYKTDVSTLLTARVGSTALLVLYAGALILVFGIGLGVLAGLRGRVTRTVINVVTTVAMGAPTFVVAIALIAIFATTLDWLPIYGTGEGLTDRLAHLTLPAIALSLSYVAYVATVTRAAVDEEKVSEHVETAVSRGTPQRLITRRHVMRNAVAPILTVSGLSIAGLFAGTAVAEQAFGVNGIGSLLVDASAKGDLAVVQVISLFMVAAFVVVNAVIDAVNALLDPRTALEGAAA